MRIVKRIFGANSAMFFFSSITILFYLGSQNYLHSSRGRIKRHFRNSYLGAFWSKFCRLLPLFRNLAVLCQVTIGLGFLERPNEKIFSNSEGGGENTYPHFKQILVTIGSVTFALVSSESPNCYAKVASTGSFKQGFGAIQ